MAAADADPVRELVRDLISQAVKAGGNGSQTRLAEAVGVRVQTVNKWVMGQTTPEYHRLGAIEEARCCLS